MAGYQVAGCATNHVSGRECGVITVHTPRDALVHTPRDALVHTTRDALVHAPRDALAFWLAMPEGSQMRQSRATQPTVHAGCFSVSIIHRTLTWTTGSLTCA